MKLSTSQSNLSRGIQKVLNIVPPRTTLPILSNLLLETAESPESGGSLRISATDLDISISTEISVETDEPGSITVPARKFAEILRELPDCPLSVEIVGNRVSLLSESGSYSLMGLPAEDFPRLPPQIEGAVIHPEGDVLARMVEKTIFAVSTDETRPALTGVLWQVDEEKMGLVATDGHRLAKIAKRLPSTIPSPSEIIVPPKALSHLLRLISGGDQLRGVTIGENHILFDLAPQQPGDGGGTVLFCRVIEGPYPDIGRVIPRNNEKKVVVTNDVFSSALRRVSVLSDPQTHQVRLSLRRGSAELSATSQEIGGEAKETIVVNYSGEDLDIGYNASYLLEILKRMGSDEVLFELDTPVSAGVVKPVQQPEDESYLCLIMPLRLNS